MMKLKTIDKALMYKVLSVPTFTGKEHLMVEFLAEYVQKKGYEGGIDDKGNVYICKGKLPEGEYFPCVTAHMDTVHHEQIPFIEAGKPIPLVTKKVNGKHCIFAKGFGLGGDDKAGIVVALSIVDKLSACKAVFFVEEEVGCAGSQKAELEWFNDVGYIMAFDAPASNCASWSCNGVPLFNKAFYEIHLAELSEKFGLTKFEAHPYTDIMVLRTATSLMCMNFGAGYHRYHTSNEYCIAEEMDHAATMGLYIINRLGYIEYVFPLVPKSPHNTDGNKVFFKA